MKLMKSVFLVVIMVAFVFLGPNSFANEIKPKLSLKMDVWKEQPSQTSDETVELVPAENVQSGDILVYSIVYANLDKDSLIDAEIIDPIPSGTVLISFPASSGVILKVSQDGEIYHEVVAEKSFIESFSLQNFPPASCTSLKWIFPEPVLPGAYGELKFRTRVR